MSIGQTEGGSPHTMPADLPIPPAGRTASGGIIATRSAASPATTMSLKEVFVARHSLG
jgi:hypothetical protein